MNSRPTTILVVDDSDLDVEKFERSFRNLQFTCNYARARDGEEALEMIASWPTVYGGEPSLILLDINMPRMSGLELLAELRQHFPELRVPIFMTTTSTLPGDITQAYEHGVCGYIVKPVTLSESQKLMSTAEAFWQRKQVLSQCGPGSLAE